MTDYNYDQNSGNLSDEYRSDLRKSDQYAEAARQANLQKQDDPETGQSGYRKVQFEHGDYDDRNDEVLARERAFRESIESVGYRDDSYSGEQRSLDLDDLDNEFDQTGPYQADNRVRRSAPAARKERLNPKRARGPVSSRRPERAGPSHLRDIIVGLQQSLFLALSKRPMQAFHLNLHWGSLGILALINILLVAGLNTIVYSKVLSVALGGFTTDAESPGAAKIFGISTLSQLASFLVVVVMVFVLTILLGSERRGFKQFVQTATLSALPYSFILLISLIVSIFLPQVGIILALTGKIHAYIYLYAGFQKGHPTKKNSPFWFFILLIAVVLVVQYLFVTWAL